MRKKYPTLKRVGFLNNDHDLARELFNNFESSRKSQSIFYSGEIKSLIHLIQSYGHDKDLLIEKIEDSLMILYKGHFEVSMIDVKSEDRENIRAILISISLKINGVDKLFTFTSNLDGVSLELISGEDY